MIENLLITCLLVALVACGFAGVLLVMGAGTPR